MGGLGIHALGSLRVTDGEEERPLGGARQRRLLAVLLIHRDAVVSVDRIAEAVFAGEPTDAAATTLRSYVARLRRVVGDAVLTRAPGYQLCPGRIFFDVAAFESGVAAGRDALRRQDPVAAAEQLRTALALWQGEAYSEFADEPWAYPESQRLSELRLTAEELLVDADLACGRVSSVLPQIEALVRRHPLRDTPRVQLMTAYYRAGRQADALAVFRAYRTELDEELGIEPSPALVDLQRRILAQDPDLLSEATAGEALRGYRLGERLGTGPLGTVHAAHLPGVATDFAITTLRSDVADDPDFIRTFDATVRGVASLRHPAVVRPHDWWREPGAAYLVLPRLPGGTLRDRLHRSPLAHGEAVALVERVGGALRDAHAVGVVHGRLTTDAVVYDGAGQPMLTDFWPGGADPPSPADDVRDLGEVVRQGMAGGDLVPDLADVLEGVDGLGIEGLVDRLLAALGAREHVVPPGRNPYLGLRAFDETDAQDYFGRAALVDEMTNRLSGSGLPSRLILLVGASGTGKSSAVRAGLLPRLRAGKAPGSEAWFVATMLPGGSPYKELAESLRRVAVGADDLATDLAGVDGIDRTLRRVVPEGGRLLLVVDQLEELFTLTPETEQRAFLEALTHALTVPDGRLRVVATLRADYYDRPLAVQPFGSLVQDATVTIPAMLPAEIEAAVVEPARRVGRTVERALVAELVGATATDPAALPALQFVLFELAERSSDSTLTLAAYRALGGIDGAIAARAEELYRGLDDVERRQVRALFERLVVVDAGGEPTRRRAGRDELSAPAEVVDRWASARLLTLDVHPQTRVPTVEVAHEALVREWPRLRRWIEDDRSDLVVLGRIRESAAAWSDLDREASALWRGTALEAALDVAGRVGLAPLEAEFVEAGRVARDAERSAQAELIRRQARTNRRLRLQLAGIAAALVVALVGGLLAVHQRQEAVEERHIAEARELAAAAEANVRDDPERSILLALAAVDATRRHEEPVLPEALEALHRAVASARILRSFPGVGGTLDWSADGSMFVTEGTEETGIVDIRDATTGETVREWQGDEVDLNDAVFSRDSTRVVTASDEGAIRVWDIASGRKLGDVTVGSEGAAWGPSVSPDGRLVAGAWPEAGTVRVFRATGGRPWVIRVEFVLDTAFSPDGRRFAVASSGPGKVHVFDVASRRELVVFGETEGIRDLAWSPDGRRIAVATSASDAGVYDARSGRLLFVTPGHTGPLNGVAWSPDSTLLATASDDGTARVFVTEERSAQEIVRLAAQDLRNGVRSVAFSPDGTQLMTSDWAITAVKVWDIRDHASAEIVNIPGDAGTARGAVLAPDGRSVWVSEGDGRVGRYDLGTGRRVQRLPGAATPSGGWSRLALSRDGALLAVVTGWDLPFAVRDTSTGDIAFVVGEGVEGVVTAAEWDPSGEHLAVAVAPAGRDESVVRVLDRTGAEVGGVSGEPGVWISAIAFTADGDLLATGGRTTRDDPAARSIRLWDWRADRIADRIEGSVDTFAVDPTGRLVASSRFIEGVADVWDATSGERVATLEGHTGTLTDVAFDAGGERIATSAVDGSVRVWDARTGEQQVALRIALPVGAMGVRFTPDGRRLVTTWADGITRVWTLDLDELVGIAEDRVTRGLTTAECRQYLHGPCRTA